ncbi:nicotinate-nucleotide adenylyltransferase [Arcanobacterium pinnipediorum]|uniref:Probable nicotinate-nucleotide adenylyltransferase n=1 Tax=Arcanobacterium pinnipediorum TaxID=1503041 RepID=A0ABY5AH59_9ACTO|nr:nicotinate-nucleotide adenylyltransferase [Arcanobacterium pinnipediorum]USR78826.1 nicotinate-nucleotide adenylyltransferase [Arcanobacterium pinnipediorum]
MDSSRYASSASPTGSHSPRARRRIGIMGGTFDPIHHGHLVAASEAQHVFGLDEVVFVPAGDNPFKTDRHISLGEHRYLMTVIATASNPLFSVSRVDIDRGGKTYTVDTLREMRNFYPGDELFFITGADVLPQILQWKDSQELWKLAHFVGVSRPGHELDMTGLPTDGVSLLEIPAMAISSTGIRRRVREGVPAWYLVPDGVVQYINKYHLYRPEEAQTTALTPITGSYTDQIDELKNSVKGMESHE